MRKGSEWLYLMCAAFPTSSPVSSALSLWPGHSQGRGPPESLGQGQGPPSERLQWPSQGPPEIPTGDHQTMCSLRFRGSKRAFQNTRHPTMV